MESNEELLYAIITLKDKLLRLGINQGLAYPRTLEISQQLDQLMNEHMGIRS